MRTINDLADKENEQSLSDRIQECCPDCHASVLSCPCGCDPQGVD